MKRTSTKRPGFDCVRHPCGRNGCGTRSGACHGIHCEDWTYVVSEGDFALELVVFSGVMPASVPFDAEFNRIFPIGRDLTLHVGFSLGETPGPGEECEYLESGRCFGGSNFRSYTAVDDFVNTNFQKGSFEQPESFWASLEAELREWSVEVQEQRMRVDKTT